MKEFSFETPKTLEFSWSVLSVLRLIRHGYFHFRLCTSVPENRKTLCQSAIKVTLQHDGRHISIVGEGGDLCANGAQNIPFLFNFGTCADSPCCRAHWGPSCCSCCCCCWLLMVSQPLVWWCRSRDGYSSVPSPLPMTPALPISISVIFCLLFLLSPPNTPFFCTVFSFTCSWRAHSKLSFDLSWNCVFVFGFCEAFPFFLSRLKILCLAPAYYVLFNLAASPYYALFYIFLIPQINITHTAVVPTTRDESDNFSRSSLNWIGTVWC